MNLNLNGLYFDFLQTDCMLSFEEKQVYTAFQSLLSFSQEEEAYALLEPERIQTLSLLKNNQKQLQSLAGEWLVRQLLAAACKQPPASFQIVHPKDKKPYLSNHAYCFNITHASSYVAAAVSTLPIGIDLEEIGKVSKAVLKRSCSKEDWALLEQRSCSSFEEQVHLYTLMWTRKEAFVKCIGGSIFSPLFDVSVGISEDTIISFEGSYYQIKEISAPHGYCCSVCCQKKQGNGSC